MNKAALFSIFFLSLIVGCDVRNNNKEPVVRHEHESISASGVVLYMDRIAHEQVLDGINPDDSNFHSFKVGVCDTALLLDKSEKDAFAAYWNFGMEQDWCLIMNGDSVRPSFLLPVTRLEHTTKEAVLVFETGGKQPDTLIYKKGHPILESTVLTF